MVKLPPVKVKTEFFFILAFSFLIIPFEWVIAWLLASLVHELFHYAALKFTGCKIIRIEVGINGTLMETEIDGRRNEILCALSGPIGGMSLLMVGKWCPRIAICGFFQNIYNLIPVYPFDGGRALRCALRCLFSERKSEIIEKYMEYSIFFIFLLLGFYAVIELKLGFIPLILAVILIIKNKRGKTTCKERTLGVK